MADVSSGLSVSELASAGNQTRPAVKSNGLSVASLAAKPKAAEQPRSQLPKLLDATGHVKLEYDPSTAISPKSVAPALNRGLSWINEQLEQSDYGRSVINSFKSAAELQASGRSHVTHAQGPLAPVEGLGGIAEMGLGALATLFAPVTALIEQGAVKPAQEVTRVVIQKQIDNLEDEAKPGFRAKVVELKKQQAALQETEETVIQSVAGLGIGKGATPKPATPTAFAAMNAEQRAAFLARKVDMRAKFDSLAATDPGAAGAIADHLEQVDPLTAKYLKRRIQKFVDASDKELSIIGKNAADAAIAELEGDYDKIRPKAEEGLATGEGKASPGKGRRSGAAEPLIAEPERDALGTPLNVERASATIRTTVKEGTEALENNASGESSASLEAINRSQAEKAAGQNRYILHEDDTVTPLTGVDAVDIKASPGEVIVQRGVGAADFTVLDRGGLTQGLAQGRVSRAVGLGKLSRTEGPEIIYFNSGVPVTRASVQAAFKAVRDVVPGVGIATAKLSRLYEGFIETFNPEAKGAAAKIAGSAIAQNFFKQTEAELKVWEQGKERRTYWNKMGSKPSMEFINSYEKGQRFSNPMWEENRKFYQDWNSNIVRQDIKTYASSGKELPYDPIDNYLSHLFLDQEGVIRWAEKKYGKRWADPRFIKERSFNLYQEAIDAGFTPKFTNPEEIMQARQVASDIAALRTNLLQDLARKGVAVEADKGGQRPPAGFSPNSRRSPTGVWYWVRSELDPLMYNVFDSKSLWNLQGSAAARGVSQVFRGWMAAKNALIPFKLAWSAFHPVHVTHIDAAAELTRAQELALGNPTTKNVVNLINKLVTGTPTSPVGFGGIAYRAWWDNPKTGYPILRVFQGKRPFESLSEGDKAAYRDLAESGMVPTRPREEIDGSIQKIKDGIAKKTPSSVFHLPNAVLAAISHPIYNLWIPTLKIASAVKDMKAWRELNPEGTSQARQEAFRRIAKNVESRYGEMNYQSLFMNKMIKDILVGTNLSLGWNLGFLNQYVGGALDVTKLATQGKGVKAATAEGLASRPLFVANYVASGLAIGGLMTYWLGGRVPSSFLDYTNPDSGEKDQYGKPIRLNTPFYTHEFAALDKHIAQEGLGQGLSKFVVAKGSGLYEMASAAATGVNNLGDEIRDPEAPAYKQLEQTLAYELSEINSISLKAINLANPEAAAKMRALAVAGFSPAGKYISQTDVEGKISSEFNRVVRPKERPFQAVEMSKDVKELRGLFAKDDPSYDEKLETAAKKYDMSDKDVRKMEKLFNSPKEAEFDPSIYMFQKLPWETQKPLLDKMTPEERDNYLPHISKDKQRKYERETEDAT